jgi:hypothetical protein
MGKWLVVILATCAALGILVHLFGASHMSATAVTVPGTEHTPTFGITWTMFLKLVKGK